LALSFKPAFSRGLILYFNRTYTSKWADPDSAKSLLNLFLPFKTSGGADDWDQHVTVGFSYSLPLSLNIYTEIGYNDTPAPGLKEFISNFSHTLAFTAGLRKGISIPKFENVQSEILFEYTHLQMSPFYSQFLHSNNFYMHHQITQGYTNKGQWLGAGIGTGGNSQFLGYKIYYPSGSSNTFIYRYNYDNDFLIRETTPSQGYPPTKVAYAIWREKTALAIGIQSRFFLTNYLSLSGEFTYTGILHPYYDETNINNFHLSLAFSMSM
jgi:hypothetical protein